jgi:hypothetical protein
MAPEETNASPGSQAGESTSTSAADAHDRQQRTSIADLVDSFLRDKGKGDAGKSGNYRSDAARELDRFVSWLREEDLGRDPTFADLDERTFRRYARFLVGRGTAKATTRTYYAYVSSFCGWAVDEGYLARHYANTSVAQAPLPDDDGRRSGDQQAWLPAHRDRITRYVDEQADTAIDARSDDENETEDRDGSVYRSIRACRDRALVYVLAYTAVRGAEIFRASNDDRREGLRWTDVDLAAQSLTVFRKKQQWDEASIPTPVIHPLRIYKRILDPPTDEWPVFPTFHYPTLGQLVREDLAAHRATAETTSTTSATTTSAISSSVVRMNSVPHHRLRPTPRARDCNGSARTQGSSLTTNMGISPRMADGAAWAKSSSGSSAMRRQRAISTTPSRWCANATRILRRVNRPIWRPKHSPPAISEYGHRPTTSQRVITDH